MPRRTLGKRCSSLLSISFLILSAQLLPAQSDRAKAASDRTSPQSEFSLPPRIVQPPSPWPFPILPRRPILPSNGRIGFREVARAAGTIFSGTVTAIARRPATHGQSVETVAITFHVENSIRGATPGQDLTITQWMGLWSGGQRYRIGERVVLFLYPPSKLGLTSCVAAPIGRFRIDPLGRVLLTSQQISTFRTDPVLGGKSRLTFSDFALAVRQASEKPSEEE